MTLIFFFVPLLFLNTHAQAMESPKLSRKNSDPLEKKSEPLKTRSVKKALYQLGLGLAEYPTMELIDEGYAQRRRYFAENPSPDDADRITTLNQSYRVLKEYFKWIEIMKTLPCEKKAHDSQ